MGQQFQRLIYQVCVGETPAFYDLCIASVARYCERYGIAHHVQREPILCIRPVASKRSANALRLGYLPICEKASAFSHLADFERVAIVDADVYVRATAPCIFDEPMATFSGVLERDIPSTDKHLDKVRKYSQGQYSTLTDVDWQWDDRGAAFYNMGLMLFDRSIAQYLNGQTPGQFMRRPEFERFINGEGHWRWSTDQTLLNWWVKKSGMRTQNLDWRWNALYGAVRQERIAEAHFVHFFLAEKMERGGAEIPGIISRL